MSVVDNYNSLKDEHGKALEGSYNTAGHTCIGTVCGIINSTGRGFNKANYRLKSGNYKAYIGNQTFIDNAYGSSVKKDGKWVTGISPTEDVYKTSNYFNRPNK